MSVRRTPMSTRFRRRVRRAALLLGVLAAFLPTVIPGLHTGHGFPTLSPPAVAHVQHAAQQSARDHDGHHEAHHQTSDRSDGERDDGPASPDRRPINGACPICRTLQQIAAIVVPEIATVIARTTPGEEIVERPVVFVSAAAPYEPTQPRAPPVDA
jgi:hypothetical protein